jgi:5'-3' exonuclease
VKVYLVDGTYELFRHFFAIPRRRNRAGREVAATRGVLRSLLSLIEAGATHLAVATDHVIESFRNDLWPDYKDSAGVDADLLSQFGLLEEALRAMGLVVWPMVEYEADDALATGAALAAADERVEQVLICTPDKDLSQCVAGARVVQFDRRRRLIIDEDGVVGKFGVPPSSIPDYLALVGDKADGYPGLPGWGAKTTARVLARYGRIEEIPADPRDWRVPLRAAERLAAALADGLDRALLFRRLARLDLGAPVSGSVDELEWSGPTGEFPALCAELDDPRLEERAGSLAAARRSASG